MPGQQGRQKYNVGGLLLDRPFKIRRLGHFGFDNVNMAESLKFYSELLGFRVSDILNFKRVARDPKMIEGLGSTDGYMLRYGTDHHAFALFPRRVRQALNRRPSNKEVTTNQITFQVGSLREVVEGHAYFVEHGIEIQRQARPVLIGDIDDAATDRGGADVALNIIATHHVQDHVHALAAGRFPRRGDEILCPVIDRASGAELFA